jgi:hypothetical protein
VTLECRILNIGLGDSSFFPADGRVSQTVEATDAIARACSSLVITIPPSPLVMCFELWKLKLEA